jgi:hypothetical protein
MGGWVEDTLRTLGIIVCSLITIIAGLTAMVSTTCFLDDSRTFRNSSTATVILGAIAVMVAGIWIASKLARGREKN